MKNKPPFLRIMKCTIVFLFAACLQVSAHGYSQNKITLNLRSAEVKTVLSVIEKSSVYRFLYNQVLVTNLKRIDIVADNEEVTSVLDRVFLNTGVSYQLLANNLIVLKPVAIPDAPPVTGRVVSSTGEPIAGVSVTLKGAVTGTSTDADGNFSITVPDGATIVFSSVGFAPQEIKITGDSPLNVKMQAATSSMDEVVVVGYGTQRRTDLTGSIASVKGSEIAKQQVLTATQAIQGKVAGVQIISSGEPNSLPIVRVRGAGSMLGGANPLYVVDGVITDDIRNINSADIVSMDVLKDASATAIYGMRAANGVLLITTKKGRTGRMIVAYDGSVGMNEASHLVNMAGANQYAGYLNEASIYYGTGDSAVTTAKLADGYNTDWYDAILRRGFQQNHNISLSGGNEKITYFFSAGYITQQGLLTTNNLSRFTLRSNNEYKINNVVKLSTLLSYSRTNLDSALLDAFGNAYRDAPYIPAKVGGLYGNTSLSNNVGNALLGLEKNNNNGLSNRVQGTIALDIKPLSWLTFRSSYGVDLNFYKQIKYGYTYVNSGDDNVFLTAGGNEIRNRSTLEVVNNNFNKWVWDNTLTANKSFGDHNFILLVGTTAEKFNSNELSGKRFDVPANSSQWYLGAGNTEDQTNSNTGDLWSRSSYIARLNYNFNGKYLLTGTFRADGTSRFASSNRWGYFPSVGAAWNIAKENFMNSQQVFDNLKLRASYGRVGNDQVSTTAYRPIAGINVPYYFDQPTNQYLGIRLDDLADENVKWEITDEIDIGLDFSLLNKKLSGEIDLYDKKTKDALVLVNVPGILGDPDSKYVTNAANFENKGIELSLNWADNIGNDWSYSVSGNIAYNKNRIINLNGGQALFSGAIGDYFTTKSDNGQPIGSFFLRQVDGIFQTNDEIAASAQKSAVPGDLKYKDVSGPDGKPDGVIDDNDRVYSGSYLPKVTFGISGNVGYKGFDLSIGTYGTAGGKIYNGKKNLRGADPLDNLETVEAVNRWTPNRTNTNVPRASFGKLPASTYFIEKGDFFRINNLTVGYSLPKTILSGLHATNLRVYATVQNLATITKYSGFTPEILPGAGTVSDPGVLSAGVDLNTYPTTRVWALGVNLSF